MTSREPADELSLGRLRWTDLEEGDPVVVLVPVGSLEQHGPALGLATDAVVAAHVTSRAAGVLARERRRFVVAPVVPYGASGEHEGFPGTISIGHDALRVLLVELGRSACLWAEGVVFVNGHGGNVPTLVSAVRQLRQEGRAVAWTGCRAAGADAHAGLTETSLMLRLAPVTVQVDRLTAGPTEPVEQLMPALRAQGVRAVSPSGVLGDPTGADARRGDAILAEMVQRLVAELAEIDVDERGRLSVPGQAP
ncbi:mycofactocin system creatininase family protein [Nocardioides psychrotolerans]|uniref:Creatinine amidohydrolase n=1 Tax=Nocardioides psychrotolerans TaxID=1005945 RepID=A0A1I3BSM1_9ACTN|nr:mycofactocin biosynthesis peptidyl-dipeptidase MftE [Nocardioides psychrotolerans]GEP36469.1 mycofactocin system creatininase family protein [Nocardioides psychrotolerans]SFH65304.1 creatinine amidohydrolase [Nocardioides psychrotolerans]